MRQAILVPRPFKKSGLGLLLALSGWVAVAAAIGGAASAAEAKPTGATFAQTVKLHFRDWDLNNDGRIASDELDTLMKRSKIHGDQAAALAALKMRERHALQDKVKDYATTEEELLADNAPAVRQLDQAQGAGGTFHFERTFARLRQREADLERKLYAGDGPNFAALHQGGIGDCFFFSVVGNLVAHQPQRITRMIVPQEHGGYQVRFDDGETITVGAPTTAEILINNSDGSVEDGIWLTVLEKAVGRRLHDHVAAFKQTGEPTDAIAFGGSPAAILRMFTGHTTDTIYLRNPKKKQTELAELRRVLPEALTAHRLIEVSMAKEPPPENHGRKVPNLGYGHDYAMFRFNPHTDMVTLWNPWGNDAAPKGPAGIEHGFATKHGLFEVPLTVLYDQFSSVIVETTTKAKPPAPSAAGR